MQNQSFASLRDADGDSIVLTAPAPTRRVTASDAVSLLVDNAGCRRAAGIRISTAGCIDE